MSQVLIIIKLIMRILIKPKQMSYSQQLTSYDMKTMKIFIVFISILSWLVTQFTKNSDTIEVDKVILVAILIPIIAYVLNKVIIKMYINIIRSISNYRIPFNIMERLLMPYIATYVVVLSLALLIINNKDTNLITYANLILLLWFNLQIYYLVKYRVNNGVLDKEKRNRIIKKIIYLLIISIVVIIPNHLEKKRIEERGYKYAYQNPEIREEVYNSCLEVYNQIELIMKNGQGVSQENRNKLISKLNGIMFEIETSMRTNELNLSSDIRAMINAHFEWYKAKTQNDIKTMNDQLIIYNEKAKQARELFKIYEKGKVFIEDDKEGSE